MDLENMTLLIKVADDLDRLDEAICCFNKAGFSDMFDGLNHVYEVIKNYSIFKSRDSDEDEMAYDEMLRDDTIPAQDRAKKLLGFE